MAVRTVNLAVDAYDALAAQKREGESFSEVVRRLTRSHTPLMPFAGAWKQMPKADLQAVRRFIAQSDRLSRAEIPRLARAGGGHGKSR